MNRHALYEKTRLRRGCTVGANATIVCGITVGRYAFVGAGSVVTKDVPDYGLVLGNPARLAGWMSRHGSRLPPLLFLGLATCLVAGRPSCGARFDAKRPPKPTGRQPTSNLI